MMINSSNFKRAISDVKNNRFLHSITLITIMLSILIVGTFIVFATNAGELLNQWESGIKLLVYLEDDISSEERNRTKLEIADFEMVEKVDYISANKGLENLKKEMLRQKGILDNLKNNPLPDSFEVYLTKDKKNFEKIEALAGRIEKFQAVSEVEYGKEWIGKFARVIAISRLAAICIGSMFFMVTVFIVANTIRLALYSRKDEIEVMQLVGADNKFIKSPFYIQGFLHGAAGGLGGLGLLTLLYFLFTMNIGANTPALMIKIKFMSFESALIIFVCSTLVGWLGCYISLRQFLKYT